MFQPAGFQQAGFAVCRRVVSGAILSRLRDSLPRAPRAGVRNLLEVCPAAREVADGSEIRGLASALLGRGAFVTRAILFDKTPDANWAVPFHQDATIAVERRVDVNGFGPWSVKDGVPHVAPPAAVLDRMVTIRLHVDACDESNGPLVVLPGSHGGGLLDEPQIARWKATAVPVVCTADAGDAVVMRPLLLHSSPRSTGPGPRRVVHLEFAADPLPGGLRWAGQPD